MWSVGQLTSYTKGKNTGTMINTIVQQTRLQTHMNKNTRLWVLYVYKEFKLKTGGGKVCVCNEITNTWATPFFFFFLKITKTNGKRLTTLAGMFVPFSAA
jgi:hypothetical protein